MGAIQSDANDENTTCRARIDVMWHTMWLSAYSAEDVFVDARRISP
jgi:hypothetical protein